MESLTGQYGAVWSWTRQGAPYSHCGSSQGRRYCPAYTDVEDSCSNKPNKPEGESTGGTEHYRRSGLSKPAPSAGKRFCQPGQGTGKAKPAPTKAKKQPAPKPVQSLQLRRRNQHQPRSLRHQLSRLRRRQ